MEEISLTLNSDNKNVWISVTEHYTGEHAEMLYRIGKSISERYNVAFNKVHYDLLNGYFKEIQA